MPIFGDNTPGSDTFPMSDGRAVASVFTLTESANVTSIWAYFEASTTAGANMRGFVASDGGGSPGTILIVGPSTPIPAGGGWVQCVITGTLTAGNYYIGLVTNDGGGHSTAQADTGGAMAMANGSFSFASPPSTWPGTDGNYGIQLNAYVEYDVPSVGLSYFHMHDGNTMVVDPDGSVMVDTVAV